MAGLSARPPVDGTKKRDQRDLGSGDKRDKRVDQRSREKRDHRSVECSLPCLMARIKRDKRDMRD